MPGPQACADSGFDMLKMMLLTNKSQRELAAMYDYNISVVAFHSKRCLGRITIADSKISLPTYSIFIFLNKTWLVRLLVALLVSFLAFGNAYSGSLAMQQGYPNVAYRNGNRVFYPPMRSPKFMLPNGLPDVVASIRRLDSSSPWYATTFFGNEKIRLKSFDPQSYKATLVTGEKVQFTLSPPNQRFELVRGAGEAFAGINMDALFRLADGSYIGLENLYSHINVHGARFMCDRIIRGVARFNSAGEVLWRKSYALLDKELTLESSWGFCQHYSGQRQLHAPLNIALLPDGSFAINFYNQLVRVNGDTGLPLKVVPRLSVIDSADVVAFTNAAYSRLNSNKNRWGVDVLPNLNVEATYYRLQQYFFFPQD